MRIPLYIEMKDKNIFIIGGGFEGTNRAKKFLSAGAKVKVLSLEFSKELEKLRNNRNLELIKGDVRDKNILERLISNSDLIVVALDTTKYNDMIINIVKKYRKLYNLANDASSTEVIVPLESEINGLRIAMTSEGKSSIVVKEALKRIVNYLSKDKEIFTLLNLMFYLKTYMKSKGVPFKLRMRLYHEVYNDNLFRKYIEQGDLESAKLRIEEIVKVNFYA